ATSGDPATHLEFAPKIDEQIGEEACLNLCRKGVIVARLPDRRPQRQKVKPGPAEHLKTQKDRIRFCRLRRGAMEDEPERQQEPQPTGPGLTGREPPQLHFSRRHLIQALAVLDSPPRPSPKCRWARRARSSAGEHTLPPSLFRLYDSCGFGGPL